MKPQLAQGGFVNPNTLISKKTIPIKDVVQEPPITPITPPLKEEEKDANKTTEIVENVDLKAIESTSTDETPVDNTIASPTISAEEWNKMLNIIFEKFPTIHHPLKDILPDLKENKMLVKVKNNIQLEHFTAKKREVLAYLREHVTPSIEDVSVILDTNLVSKKILYDHKEKLDYLREENAEISNFIEILKLTIKE